MRKVIMLLTLSAIAITNVACGASASNKAKEEKKMKTIELNAETFNKKVSDIENLEEFKYIGDKPAIIDFYATWCGPCKAVAPTLEKLADEYGDQIVIYKIDVDKERELAQAFGIRSIPTFLFIPLDGEPQMAMGAMSKAEFENAIKSVLLKQDTD